jgi:hypothetical protein
MLGGIGADELLNDRATHVVVVEALALHNGGPAAPTAESDVKAAVSGR